MNAPQTTGRKWERLSRRERISRFFRLFVIALAVSLSMNYIEVIPEFIKDAPVQVLDLFRRMWPIDFAYYPGGIHKALVDTLHIATLGTLLCLCMSLPIGLMVARNICKNRVINWLGMFLLVASRSVSVLVWALLFVAVFGPGPLAGMITIAIRSIGFVGKLFGEALEETHTGPIEALRAAGASPVSIFIKGYWPQVLPAFWAIALFRWDINVRESSVIGLVGAGGIGLALDEALALFHWDRVALILLCIFIIVIIGEMLVTQIRKKII